MRPGRDRRSGVSLRFVGLFVTCLVVGNVVLALPSVIGGFIEPWIITSAATAASLARILGYEVSAVLSSLTADGVSINVKNGCDGINPLLILGSAIAAYPARWPRRLLGLLLGVATIFALNIVRLAHLVIVASRYPAQLEFFHVYVWQTLMGALAVITFLLWGTFLAGRR